MPIYVKYPLPFFAGLACFVLVAFGGWELSDSARGGSWWALAGIALVALALAVLVGVLLWQRARLACQWVVVMWPTSWDAYAEEVASASGQYRKAKKLKRHIRPARIEKGTLKVPISTTTGGGLEQNKQEQAQRMADALQLSAVRVKAPEGKRNPGFIWFVFSVEDSAA